MTQTPIRHGAWRRINGVLIDENETPVAAPKVAPKLRAVKAPAAEDPATPAPPAPAEPGITTTTTEE